MSRGGGPSNPSRSFMCIRPAMTYAYIIFVAPAVHITAGQQYIQPTNGLAT